MTTDAPEEKTVQRAPDLPTLIECCLRYWWACLVAGCLLAALGLAASQIIPAHYRSTARIRLGNPQGLVDEPFESSAAKREFRHTQEELMQMPHVLRRALEMLEPSTREVLDVGPESAEDLADYLEIQLPRSSEIMKVSVSHDDAEVAYLLVNAVTQSYLEEIRRADNEELRKKLATLDRLQNESDERLDKVWSDLQALARQIGSGDPAALSLQAQAEIENYRAYSRRMRELHAEKRTVERQIRAIRDDPSLLAEQLPEEASMNSVKFAMFSARLKKEKALMEWGPKHPDVLAAQREEELLREYYQKATSESLQEPVDRQEQLLREPLATLARLEDEERSLKSMLGEIEDRLEIVGGDNAARLEILRNEVARLEKLSDRIWQTRESLQVESNADHRVQLVSLGNLPTKRDTSKRQKLSVVMAGGGFGFAVLLIAGMEFLTGRLHSRRDVAARTALELPGSGNALPRAIRIHPLETAGDAGRHPLEMLLAQLLNTPSVSDARVWMVTSDRSAARRGHLAEHLAGTLAGTGKSTVLVQLDFRESLDDELESDQALPGLAEYLDEPREGPPPVRKSPHVPRLYLVPRGRRTAEPLPLLTGNGLAECLEQLQSEYQHVVLDVAAVLAYPDALHVGRLADAAILAVQKNVSTAAALTLARQQLESLRLPVFGIFLQ